MKPRYCLRALLCPILMAIASIATGQTNTHLPLTGHIINNETKKAVEGATVAAIRSHIKTLTDEDGTFSIDLPGTDTLLVSGVGYQAKKIQVTAQETRVQVELVPVAGELQEVTVNTGYQRLPKERATGSFDVVGTTLLNRRVSTNVLDKIENLTPGVLFDRNAGAPDALLIRGRSTIYANAAPLVVVDNFPYDGDIGNINPNDVESVTILKDAAAASIWGARAGNGVIVITTKKGKTAKPRVELNSSVTLIGKPDLYNVNTISSSDYIDLEKWLFGQGYYSSDEFNNSINYGHPPFTPVVNVLIAGRDSVLSEAKVNEKIAALATGDARKDISKYLYQTGVNGQYQLNVSGSSDKLNYYTSAGWDRNVSNLVGSDYNRISVRSGNTFTVTPRLQVSLGLGYTESETRNGDNPGYSLNNGAGKGLYPYARLVNADGSPATLVKDYSTAFTDTAGGGRLLDWTYNPIRDINQEIYRISGKDLLATASVHYSLTPDLGADIRYQYEAISHLTHNEYTGDSYFARNLENQYAQIDYTTGFVTRPIPIGGILDEADGTTASHQGRAQLNYSHFFRSKHQVSAIAGTEIRSLASNSTIYRLYGYEPDKSSTASLIDYITQFPLFTNAFQTGQVPSASALQETTDRFFSLYANAAYTYDKRYTVSASGRHDAANLFGVDANRRGTPLWSAGGAWTVSNEHFYHLSWLPALKLRVTYGYSGNISRLATANTTIYYGFAYSTPEDAARIKSPANKNLQWEQVNMTNMGLDFTTKNNVISGSLEYYHKRASHLLGQAPLDPTLGVLLSFTDGTSYYYGNVAAMTGNGVDVQLTSRNLRGAFTWTTDVLFSHAATKVSHYDLPVSTGFTYLNATDINPVKGKPVYSIYSYAWVGLDGQTGAPQGRVGGKISEDYAGIVSSTPLDSMIYNGPAQPTFFGAVRNSFGWKGISVSINISYKLGYYFRKASVRYSDLYSNWTGSGDYAKRWQQPGDEKHTNVPARTYPADSEADAFYQYSDVLVLPGDHIRLEDIALSYEIDKAQWHHLPFAHARVYVYANNLGVLWVKNRDKIDPYYNNLPKNGKSLALGVTLGF